MLTLDTVQNLEDGNPIKYDLRNALDEACLLIDWSYPGSDAFYESVHKADTLLNEKIRCNGQTVTCKSKMCGTYTY